MLLKELLLSESEGIMDSTLYVDPKNQKNKGSITFFFSPQIKLTTHFLDTVDAKHTKLLRTRR